MKNRNVQTEIDAGYLYGKLAEHETDETIASVYRKMSEIEKGHAEAFAKKENIRIADLPPSWRAKTLNTIGKVFGYNYVLGALIQDICHFFTYIKCSLISVFLDVFVDRDTKFSKRPIFVYMLKKTSVRWKNLKEKSEKNFIFNV